MKNKTLLLLLTTILLSFFQYSCKDVSVASNKTESNTKLETDTKIEKEVKAEIENTQVAVELDKKDAAENKVRSLLRPKEEIEFGKRYTDTVNFISFDDNSDYWYFLAQKNKETIQIIYHSDMLINELVKGDEIVIDWEMKRLEEAGDDEITYVKPYLISFNKIGGSMSSNTVENKSNSFVISCGSGCAMTYSENKIVAKDNSKEVTFIVGMYINEKISDEYYETYVYLCDTSNEVAQIKLKGNDEDKKEDIHPEILKNLKSYIDRLCKN